MPNRAELLRTLASESGLSLRTCLEYDDESMRYLYRRDDVDPDASRERARQLQQLYRAEEAVAEMGELRGKGKLRGSAHYFDDVLILVLPDGEDPTFGFSVSVDIGSDLADFLDGCRETLFDENLD